MPRVRRHLSYANAMATIAVFIALGGGAYAVGLKRNSVGAKQIKPNAVSGPKVLDASLGTADIDGSLNGGDISDGSLGAADLAPGSVGPGAIPNPGAVGIGDIPPASNCGQIVGTFCGVAGNAWTNPPSTFGYAGYFVDSEGFVHLQGHAFCANCGGGSMFTLPIELAPTGLSDGGLLAFPGYRAPVASPLNPTAVAVLVEVETSGGGPPHLLVQTSAPVNGSVIGLNGITWRTN